MAEWTKIGTIMKKKDGQGQYLKLDIRVGKDVKGEITLKNGGILNIQNPRKRKGITEEQIAKIPDYVMAEVFLAPAKEE